MLIKLLNGDTINGLKLRREGVLALQYQELLRENRYRRWLKRLENRTGSAGAMSGGDPFFSPIVETIAMSIIPVGRVAKPVIKALKKSSPVVKSGSRVVTGIDGNSYKIANTVSDDALDLYIADGMIYGKQTRTVPDKYLIEQNILRELSWIPAPARKSLSELFYTGKTKTPTVLFGYPYKLRLQILNLYGRFLKALEVAKSPKVITYSNVQSVPKKEMESYNYKVLSDEYLGFHTKSGSYVTDMYAPETPSIAIHEATHGWKTFLPNTKDLKDLLKKVYFVGDVDEMAAVNALYRKHIADKLNKPSYDRLNTEILNMTEEDALNLFKEFQPNAYALDYAKAIFSLPKAEIPQWVNNFKLALIKVPVLTGLTIGLTKKKKE